MPDETKGSPLSVFSALRDLSEKKFPKGSPLQFFWVLRQTGYRKIPKGPPFNFFGAETFFKKIFSAVEGNTETLMSFSLFLSLGYGADLGRSRLVLSRRSIKLRSDDLFYTEAKPCFENTSKETLPKKTK